MAADQGKKKYKDPYKLVLLKEETLETVGSYRLTPLNVYILVSTILVITSLIVVAVIFFTPVKRLVPGYADITQNREYMRLYNDIRSLEEQVEAQNQYIERFRNIAIGEEPTEMASDSDTLAVSVPQTEGSGSLGFSQSDAGFNAASPIDLLYIIPPLTGTVIQEYKPEEGHYGVDIVAPKNTPVKAILDGHVITSDWTLETGNTIGIQHSNNVLSFYKHNARNLKRLGSFVEAGEAVAIIGNTGELSSGPHLHFELWMEGKTVDPTRYVSFE